jgi:hypothetical protein
MNRTVLSQTTQRAAAVSCPLPGIASAFAPLLLLYGLYTLVRWLVLDHGRALGNRNADHVLALEKRLGLDHERWLQQHAIDIPGLISFLNYYYVYAFFPVLIVAGLLSWRRVPAVFRFWRLVFAVSLIIALAGFAFFPLTPPRLLPAEHGYVDTLLQYGPRYYGDEFGNSLFNAYGSIPSLVNEYAAMPSMHVGWSAIAGILLVKAFPHRRWLIAAAVVHVLIMQLAVVATGNHYVIDGPVGLAIVGVSFGIVSVPGSRWPAGASRSAKRVSHHAPLPGD